MIEMLKGRFPNLLVKACGVKENECHRVGVVDARIRGVGQVAFGGDVERIVGVGRIDDLGGVMEEFHCEGGVGRASQSRR